MGQSIGVKWPLLGSALALGLLALICVTGSSGPVVRAQVADQTWYVDGNCTVCGAGTPDNPFSTINQALAVIDDGDTILIAQGTYTENLQISNELTLMGGYAPTLPTWTRDTDRYKTIIVSDDPTVPGDWNGDWLGSPAVVKDGGTYKMWYSGGNEVDGESVGYAYSPDGVNWFKPLSGPLLEAGPLDAWDGAGVSSPAVVATGGGFWMWYVGVDAMNRRAIGYATSPDGLTWQKHNDNPILGTSSQDSSSFGFPTVVQDGPSDYRMWYSGGDSIWLATSSNGLDWTKHMDAPALSPGAAGAWDDDEVYAPQVVALSTGGYGMWYTAEGTGTSEPAIGYAWSDDGDTWTRSPENPVLTGATDSWEEEGVTYPAAIREGATNYTMWYRGEGSGGQAFGQATSSDGVAWTKWDGNPVLSGGSPTVWGSSIVTLWESSGETVVDGLTITGGSAKFGGGIFLSKASSTIRGCTVTDNTAYRYGGGIYASGETGAPLIENTVISNNTAEGAGGVYVGYASSTISDSLIVDNLATQHGGGLYLWSSPQSTLISTTVAHNAAIWEGGIELSFGSTLEVYDSSIADNTAAQRAGVRIYDSTLAMTNTFVVDNQALAGQSGAMYFWRASGRLVNVTIAANSATDGIGGIYFATDRSGDELIIVNGILAFNGNDDLNCDNGTCSVTYSDVQEGIAGAGNISADPRFADLATGDYHLGFGSPAIDTGLSGKAPATDFEGDPRPAGRADMGADEFSGDIFKVYLALIR